MAVRYVRPKRGTPYGTGDGSSYANAWNGIGAIQWGALNELGKSSTLWVCGTHLERLDLYNGGSLEYGGSGFTKKRRMDGLVIRGDFDDDPGLVDARGMTYHYVNRSLAAGERLDFERWWAGTDNASNARTPAAHLRAAKNLTVRNLRMTGSKVLLSEDLAANPTIGAEASGWRYVYFPNTTPRPCQIPPYSGGNVVYPNNDCVVADLDAGNIRITGCSIDGDQVIGRRAISLHCPSGMSVCVDNNTITGFMRGAEIDISDATRKRAVVRVYRNRLSELGFDAYDNFQVDGIVMRGDFSVNECYAAVYENEIAGHYRDGINTEEANGVIVKWNKVRDQKIQLVDYPTQDDTWGFGTTPFFNVDEIAGSTAAIRFGGANATYGKKNHVTSNIVINGGLLDGIAGGAQGRESIIAGNLLVCTLAAHGANGLQSAGATGKLKVYNNTSYGFKRGGLLESPDHEARNNIFQRAVKADATYLKSVKPAGDLVILGASASGSKLKANCYATDSLVIAGGATSIEDADSIDGDPRFKDVGALDFRLRPSSACLSSGIFPGIYLVDASGYQFRPPYPIGALGKDAISSHTPLYIELMEEQRIGELPAIVIPPEPQLPEAPPEEPPPGTGEESGVPAGGSPIMFQTFNEIEIGFDNVDRLWLDQGVQDHANNLYKYQIQCADPQTRVTLAQVGRHGGTAISLKTFGNDDEVSGSHANERCDLNPQYNFGPGTEVWFAHSIYLPPDFLFPPYSPEGGTRIAGYNWHIIWQFHDQAGQPPFPIEITVDEHSIGPFFPRLRTRINAGQPKQERLRYWYRNGEQIQAGFWYDFVHHMRLEVDGTGFWRNWLRRSDESIGAKEIDYTGPTLVSGGVYPKAANYHSYIPGAGNITEVIHDRITWGFAPEDVVWFPLEGL